MTRNSPNSDSAILAMFISGLGLLTKNIILKLRRKDAQCTLDMRNSTGSPLFSDFKSDLSRVVRSRPLAKGTKTLGTRVLSPAWAMRSRTCADVVQPRFYYLEVVGFPQVRKWPGEKNLQGQEKGSDFYCESEEIDIFKKSQGKI